MSSPEMTIEPVYVVDTHALIWYLLKDKKLGKQASDIFSAAEQGDTRLILSAIVIAELYFANRKNQWFADFATLYQLIRSQPYFRLVAFIAAHVLDFNQDLSVPE